MDPNMTYINQVLHNMQRITTIVKTRQIIMSFPTGDAGNYEIT